MDPVPTKLAGAFLNPELQAKLESLAEATGQTKSEVLRSLLQQATLVRVPKIEAEVRLKETPAEGVR